MTDQRNPDFWTYDVVQLEDRASDQALTCSLYKTREQAILTLFKELTEEDGHLWEDPDYLTNEEVAEMESDPFTLNHLTTGLNDNSSGPTFSEMRYDHLLFQVRGMWISEETK